MDAEAFRDVIRKVIGNVVNEPELRKLAGSGKVFGFGATDLDGVNWYVDARDGVTFHEGVPDKADVRATMASGDWIEVLKGNLTPTKAMLRKKLKVQGSVLAITSVSMDAFVRVYKEQMAGEPA